MKDFIKFLRLDSLCGQLVAIAVLSLAALQCVNYYAVYSIQQSYAGRVSSRGSRLPRLRLPGARAYERGGARGIPRLARQVARRAGKALPLPRSRSAGMGDGDRLLQIRARARGRYGNSDAGGNPSARRSRARAIQGRARGIVAALRWLRLPMMQMFVQSADRSWLELSQPLSVTDRRLIWRQRIFIMLESLICSAVVIIFIVRAMLPLNKLGKEVERFGANPETASPLPERGNYEVREVARSFNKMLARVQRSLAEAQQHARSDGPRPAYAARASAAPARRGGAAGAARKISRKHRRNPLDNRAGGWSLRAACARRKRPCRWRPRPSSKA